MKILFYFGHPAQYLFLRKTIRHLSQSKTNELTILIKTKDVLESLIKKDGLEYINILPHERGRSKLSIALSFIKRNITILRLVLKKKPHLLIGTDGTLAQAGWLTKTSCITTLEDDYAVIKTLADITYPFTKTILCPQVCDVGKWKNKKTGYDGYMKLGYLHPNVFIPEDFVIEKYALPEKFILVRLARLTAHHDFGIKGIDHSLLDTIINSAESRNYKVFISSEGNTHKKYDSYQLKIEPSDMHHLLAKAALLICDSQSMSVEAAMLGVPSLRYSSFSGRISVLEELEHSYHLTYGFKPGEHEKLLSRLNELLDDPELNVLFKKRRQNMLRDKIDVSAFIIWFIENYPESLRVMKETPDYQHRFK